MRHSYRYFTVCCTLLLCAGAAEPQFPAVTSAKQLTQFLPPQWHVIKQITGDLNKDRHTDAVAVAEGPNTDDPDATRHLLVAFATPTGIWQLASLSRSPVLDAHDGGVFGDPLESVAVERGTIVITHYGGSRDRWGCTDRFRYQDGEFFHIGHKVIQHDTMELTSREVDTNLLTGRQVITSGGGNTPAKTTVRKVPIEPLGNMEAYTPCGK